MSTISSAVNGKLTPLFCGTTPISVAISLLVISEMDFPSTKTVPARGCSAWLIHLSSVVLPDPLGPSIPTISPGVASKLTSSRILALL